MPHVHDNYYGTIILDILCRNAPDTIAPLRNTGFLLRAGEPHSRPPTEVEHLAHKWTRRTRLWRLH